MSITFIFIVFFIHKSNIYITYIIFYITKFTETKQLAGNTYFSSASKVTIIAFLYITVVYLDIFTIRL